MSHTLIRSALFVGVLAGFSSGAAAAPLFTDSFEEPQNSRNWQVYQSFSDWDATDGAGIEIQTNGAVSGVATPFGDQYVELDSDTDRGGISAPTNSAMTREETLARGMYEIVFHYLPRTGSSNDNTIKFFVDGDSQALMTNVVGTVDGIRTPTTQWQETTFQFFVDGTDNDYGLTFAAAGNSNEFGGFIDNVSLTRVPMPGTIALLGAGLIALGGFARRRGRLSRRESHVRISASGPR